MTTIEKLLSLSDDLEMISVFDEMAKDNPITKREGRECIDRLHRIARIQLALQAKVKGVWADLDFSGTIGSQLFAAMYGEQP